MLRRETKRRLLLIPVVLVAIPIVALLPMLNVTVKKTVTFVYPPQPPFYNAIAHGSAEDLKRLVEANLSDARDYHYLRNGPSLMELAMGFHRYDDLEVLLAEGFDVEARVNGGHNDGWTPLTMAVDKGDEAMVDFQLKHKADPEDWNAEGQTPMHLARQRHFDKISTMLQVEIDRRKHPEDVNFSLPTTKP